MSQPGKEKPLKKANKILTALKGAMDRRLVKRKLKKTEKKARRKELIYKLRGKAGDFMKAAFEPKSAKTARRKKKKLEKKK